MSAARAGGRWLLRLAMLAVAAAGCARRAGPEEDIRPSVAPPRAGAVKPGITVLLEDSIGLVRGKRVGLLADAGAVDEHGARTADLLRADERATGAGVRLVTLLAPEQFESASLPDSVLAGLDVILVDLQDIGTRTWTRVGALVNAMRAAARRTITVVVLDRPNPLGGSRVEGPMLDTALADAGDPRPGSSGRAYALYPLPLRHGMTLGELAFLLDDRLELGAAPRVVPMRGWRRAMWQDETGIPWIRPTADVPTPESALLHVATTALEATNVSIGRGTSEPFARVGAPWLRARELAELLAGHDLPGVRFEPETFTPSSPSDGRFAGRRVPGVRIVVADRDRVQVARVGAALVWGLAKLHADSLRVDTLELDRRLGSASARRALLAGEDPDAVIDRELPGTVAFERRARPHRLYR